MDQKANLETLRQQYFDLSKDFLLALQQDCSSDELEVIREKIREIVAKMESHETAQQQESAGDPPA
jgi:hypothetical protein